MRNEEKRENGILQRLGRYKYVFLIAALGAALMLWPSDTSPGSDTVPAVCTDNGNEELSHLEEEMEKILSKMQGVGRVDVMLTLNAGKELVLAADSTLRYSGDPQNPNDYDRTSETVTVSGGDGAEVVVTQERSPRYRGALIVCEGGDNDAVRLRVMEAVSALTGLGSDRIAVVRWGAEGVAGIGIEQSEGDLS